MYFDSVNLFLIWLMQLHILYDCHLLGLWRGVVRGTYRNIGLFGVRCCAFMMVAMIENDYDYFDSMEVYNIWYLEGYHGINQKYISTLCSKNLSRIFFLTSSDRSLRSYIIIICTKFDSLQRWPLSQNKSKTSLIINLIISYMQMSQFNPRPLRQFCDSFGGNAVPVQLKHFQVRPLTPQTIQPFISDHTPTQVQFMKLRPVEFKQDFQSLISETISTFNNITKYSNAMRST